MESITLPLRLPKKLIEEIDNMVKAGIYENRSEAIRDAIRKLIEFRKLMIEPYKYYRLLTEEQISPSKKDPDEVIEEIRKIREEIWSKEKEYFGF